MSVPAHSLLALHQLLPRQATCMHVTAAVADGAHASLPLLSAIYLAIICMVGQIPEFAYRDTRTPFPFPVILRNFFLFPTISIHVIKKGVRTEDRRIFVLSSRHRQRDERAGLTRNVLNKFHSVGRCRLSLVKPNLGVKCCFVKDLRKANQAEPHN